jgi:8-oxo-dGTP pyrophosphatase MutT (NUDIX family)
MTEHAAALNATAWRDSRPGKRMGAGLLIRNEDGDVLLVEPTYKEAWELPGGATEADESPAQCAGREVREELGVQLAVGRLLCVEWQPPEPDRTESLMWIYDGGVVTPDVVAKFALPTDELVSYRFCSPAQVRERMSLRLSRRVEAAMLGLTENRVVELEAGLSR